MRPIIRFTMAAMGVILLGAGAAFADTVSLNTASKDQSIRIQGVQQHDVFQDVLVNQTCSREVFAGYDQECGQVSEEVCHPGTNGHPMCHTISRWVCHDVA